MDATMALIVVGVVLLVVVGITIVIVATGMSSKCPTCNKWWSMKEVERKELSREPGVKTVTRTETQKDLKGNASQVQRQVQVQVMRIRYDGLFRCSKCAFEQRKEFTEEKENW